MADLKFLGVNFPLENKHRQADPATDRVLLGTIGPLGGSAGPLVVEPVSPVSGTDLVLDIRNGVSSSFTLAGDGTIVSGTSAGPTWTHQGNVQIRTGGGLILGESPGGGSARGTLSLWKTTAGSEPVGLAGIGKLYTKDATGVTQLFYLDGSGTEHQLSPSAGSDHGLLAGLADDDHTQYLLASGTRALSGDLLVDALVTIDGRDISVDGSSLDTHLASTSNPHATSIANIGSGTIAQLNAAVSDADLVPTTRTVTAGTGLTGGGALSANVTINAVAHADGSIAVAADSIQVGVLATDTQHGVRGGGTQHAAATGAAAGFMSAADKTKLDGLSADHGSLTGLTDDDHTQYLLANGTRTLTGNMLVTAAVTIDGRDISADGAALDAHVASSANPHSTSIANIGSGTLAQLNAAVSDADLVPAVRTVSAGTGLTGGGALSANITLNVVAHADGSIVTAADSVQVGILATDTQHGVRGGGTQHSVATGAVAGFMSAADKLKLDGLVNDHGALTGLADDDHVQYLLIDGTRAMTGTLRPNAHGTLDLGLDHETTPLWWRNAFIQNIEANDIVTSTLEASTSAYIERVNVGSGSLLDPSIEFWDTGFYAPSTGQLMFESEGADVLSLSSGGGLLAGNWLPSLDLTFNLGSASLRWNEVHAGTITADTITGDVTGYLKLDGTTTMTGPILAADGDAANPAITFGGTPGNGFYRVTSSTFGVSTSGSSKWLFGGASFVANATGAVIGQNVANGSYTIRGNMTTSVLSSSILFTNNSSFQGLTNLATQRGTTWNYTVAQDVTKTVGFSALQIDLTNTSLGTGAQYLIDMKVGGTTVAGFTNEAVAGDGFAGRLIVAGGSAAKPGIAWTADQDTGIYGAGNNVTLVMNGTAYWGFAAGTLYIIGSQPRIQTQTVGSGLVIGGRADQTGTTTPSLTIENYASQTFKGANIAQQLIRGVATLAQTGSSSFTALDLNITETTVGGGAQYLINAKAGTLGTTQKFAVTNLGSVLAGEMFVPSHSFVSDPGSGMGLISTDLICFFTAGAGRWLTSTSEHTTTLDIVPNSDLASSLGYPAQRWASVHSGVFVADPGSGASPSMTFQGFTSDGFYSQSSTNIGATGNLNPDITNTWTLGTSLLRWLTVYTNTVASTNVATNNLTINSGGEVIGWPYTTMSFHGKDMLFDNSGEEYWIDVGGHYYTNSNVRYGATRDSKVFSVSVYIYLNTLDNDAELRFYVDGVDIQAGVIPAGFTGTFDASGDFDGVGVAHGQAFCWACTGIENFPAGTLSLTVTHQLRAQ